MKSKALYNFLGTGPLLLCRIIAQGLRHKKPEFAFYNLIHGDYPVPQFAATLHTCQYCQRRILNMFTPGTGILLPTATCITRAQWLAAKPVIQYLSKPKNPT